LDLAKHPREIVERMWGRVRQLPIQPPGKAELIPCHAAGAAVTPSAFQPGTPIPFVTLNAVTFALQAFFTLSARPGPLALPPSAPPREIFFLFHPSAMTGFAR